MAQAQLEGLLPVSWRSQLSLGCEEPCLAKKLALLSVYVVELLKLKLGECHQSQAFRALMWQAVCSSVGEQKLRQEDSVEVVPLNSQ